MIFALNILCRYSIDFTVFILLFCNFTRYDATPKPGSMVPMAGGGSVSVVCVRKMLSLIRVHLVAASLLSISAAEGVIKTLQ